MLDVVTSKGNDLPVVKISITTIIEDQLGIYGRRSTQGGEIGHGFDPSVSMNMSPNCIVD